MKQLIEDIKRLARTWEIWAIVGLFSIVFTAGTLLFNRAPSMKAVEANLKRIERHLEIIDGRDEKSIRDRDKLHNDLNEIKKELP